MKKIFVIVLALLLSAPFLAEINTAQAANAKSFQEGQIRKGRRDRRKSKSIGSAYKKSGIYAGRAGKRFGKNIAKGKPIVAGREFGKNMGKSGKYNGKGGARVGKKIGKTVKKIFRN